MSPPLTAASNRCRLFMMLSFAVNCFESVPPSLRVALIEIPDVLESHELREIVERIQGRGRIYARAVALQGLVNGVERRARREKTGPRKNRDPITELGEPRRRQNWRLAAFDHVRHQRQLEAGADFFHLALRLRRFDEQDV